MSVRAVRLGGVAAIVFVVLVLIGGFSASQPQADDSVAKIRSYMVDHRTAILVGVFLLFLAIPFAVWFVVVLREVLRGDRTTDNLGTAIARNSRCSFSQLAYRGRGSSPVPSASFTAQPGSVL